MLERNMMGFDKINKLSEKQFLANRLKESIFCSLCTELGEVEKKRVFKRNQFNTGLRKRQQIDKIFNTDFSSEHIVTERPKGFEFIEHDFNIPTQRVKLQRKHPSKASGISIESLLIERKHNV